MEPGLLWRRLASPLLRTVAFVALGLLAGQLIESLGWTRRLGVLARPLMRAGHLPAEAGASFTAAFASGVAANTFLATAWREGRLDDRQLTLANLLNASLPAFFLHLPSVFFVVYALLGWIALVYFGLTLIAAVARCLAVTLIARFLFPAQAAATAMPSPAPRGLGLVWRDTWRKFLQRLRRLLIIILPVYVVIFLLAEAGFFKWLGQALAGLVAWKMLPVEAMSVVVFAVVAEFTSGFAAAGALLQSGGLGWSEVVLALLLGNVAATPVRALRHQLPHYMGIFEPALGLKLVALGQGLRVASVLGVAIVFVWWM
ncbi:hypothetical protein AAU61_03500 [Desulfocarbo indianensis]|nr:hypothetical protein AAU61_03500 [Desulfocarbo indianensis]